MKDPNSKFSPTHFFELSQDLMCIAGFDGYFKSLNPAWTKILGHTEKELLSKPFLDFVHPEDRKISNEEVSNLSKGKSTVYFEIRCICKDGSIKHIQWTATPLPKEKVIYCIGRDNTECKQRENQLSENEELFKAIISNSPDHIVMQDSGLRYSMVINPQLGLTEDDMLGKTDHDFLSEEEADKLVKAKRHVMETGNPLYFETSLISRDGKPEFFEGTYKPIFDENNQPNGLIGYFRNVTENKQAEEELVKQKNLTDNYLNIMGSMIIALNREGEITLLNKKGYDILGYKEAELHGKNWFSTCLPKEIRREIEEYFELLMDGKTEVPETHENEIVRKDGQKRAIKWFNTLVKDDSGNITGLLSSGEDITEQKKAENALQDSEIRHRTYIEHSPLGIFVVDIKGKYIDVNAGACELLGYTRDELLKLSVPDLSVPEEGRESFQQLKKEGIISYEGRLRKKDGSTVNVRLDAVSLPDDQFIAFCTDITERKKVEMEIIKLKEGLEDQVAEKTIQLVEKNEDLQRFNDAMVDRELRMKELYDENIELRKKK